MSKFKDYKLSLVEPAFKDPLTDLILDLDHLRRKRLEGSTHPNIFFQLKNLFHMLESIGSARIEGNNTTIEEYIETKIEPPKTIPSNIKEIQNIESTLDFIDKNVSDHSINKLFISELHKMTVQGLEPPPNGEGDKTPGKFRQANVTITGSTHQPPDVSQIDSYMEELCNFINEKHSPKYDLLKVAIAHHRFVWIHPFLNGNGRTVRLLTYAMLVKQGFNVDIGMRILNPTAMFCNDRNNYYHKLSMADQGTDEKILEWCKYVLEGLKEEMEKIDKLLNYEFLKKEILYPSINYSREREHITLTEAKVLKQVTEKQVIQASDLSDIFPGKLKPEVSRQIKKLIKKDMLLPEKPGGRKYILCLGNGYLLRGIMKVLEEKGFFAINNKERM
jgi:Fic family protein